MNTHTLTDIKELLKINDTNNAIILLNKLIKFNNNNIEAIEILANAYKVQRNHEKSVLMFKRLTELLPDNAITHYNLGVAYFDNNQIKEARQCYIQSLKLDKTLHLSYNNLGMVYEINNNIINAKKYYCKAIQLYPQYLEAYYNLAHLYQKSFQYDLSIEYYTKVLQLSPNHIYSHNNLSVALEKKGDLKKCYYHLDYALSIDPKFTDALLNYALLKLKNGYINDAVKSLNDIISIDNHYIEAYINLGLIFENKKQTEQAINYYKKALNINPNHFHALLRLGMIYQMNKSFNISTSYISNAYKLYPKNIDILIMYTNELQINIEWDKYYKYKKILEKSISSDELLNLTLSPYSTLACIDNPSLQKKLTEQYAKSIVKPIHIYKHRKEKLNINKKLKIGYVSPDFRCHAVGLLIKNILRHHDHDKYIINAYSLHETKDIFNDEIKSYCDKYTDISNFPHEKSAKYIYQDKVDILVDLAGHTQFSQPSLYTYKSAPIQCHYLGYPATTGLKCIDYYLAHQMLIPKQMRQYFTEKIVYLPETWDSLYQSKKPYTLMTRSQINLPEDKFIFSCFNAHYRYTPECFAAWMKILGEVNNSILWLQVDTPSIKIKIKQQAQKYNIDPDRIFMTKLEFITEKWHNLLSDLELDTFSLSGGTAGVLNAWSGLPVITLAGQTPQSRSGSTNAISSDMEEMIAYTIDEYIKKAILLATQPELYQETKRKLIVNRKLAPLFNPQRCVKHLEHAYSMMWQHYIKYDKPTMIQVPCLPKLI